MTTQAAAPASSIAAARSAIDWIPLALVPVLALASLPLVGSVPTWVTLTVAGLAMGMMIFMMASGLTLVFGLMDVMNFAHGIFISVGAYGAATVLTRMRPQMEAGSLASDLSAMIPAVLAAIALAGFLGWFFERVLIRPGVAVSADNVLVELSNPDLEQLAEESRWALDAGRAELAALRVKLESDVLDQRARIAEARADHESARL